jgi:hypothetical protein
LETNPELLNLGTELAKYVGKSSVESIWDRIRAAKAKGNNEEIISKLEEIIAELIGDKNELIRISQAFEEQLISKIISEEDIEYITESIVPLIEILLEQSEQENTEKIIEGMIILKPLLSKETFNILQLLGFNFKRAIGEPLTDLLRQIISSNIPISGKDNIDLQILREQKEIEFYKLVQNEDAYQRFLALTGRAK